MTNLMLVIISIIFLISAYNIADIIGYFRVFGYLDAELRIETIKNAVIILCCIIMYITLLR